MKKHIFALVFIAGCITGLVVTQAWNAFVSSGSGQISPVPVGAVEMAIRAEELSRQEEYVEQQYQALLTDLQDTNNDTESFVAGRNSAVSEAVTRYRQAYLAYREADCNIDALQLYMGTGSSGIFQSCIFFHNQTFLEKLETIRATHLGAALLKPDQK